MGRGSWSRHGVKERIRPLPGAEPARLYPKTSPRSRAAALGACQPRSLPPGTSSRLLLPSALSKSGLSADYSLTEVLGLQVKVGLDQELWI